MRSRPLRTTLLGAVLVSTFTGTRWDWGTSSVGSLGLADNQISSVSKVSMERSDTSVIVRAH